MKLLTFVTLLAFLTPGYTVAQDNPDNRFCRVFKSKIVDGRFDYNAHRPDISKTRRLKLGGGKQNKGYSKDSYYLRTYALDINNDQIKDLLVIDDRPMGSRQYYQATYIFDKKGDIHGDRKALKEWLKNHRYNPRHKDGLAALFPQTIAFYQDGKWTDESFVGFNLKPVMLQGKSLLVAEKKKRSSTHWVVYEVATDSNKINPLCFHSGSDASK